MVLFTTFTASTSCLKTTKVLVCTIISYTCNIFVLHKAYLLMSGIKFILFLETKNTKQKNFIFKTYQLFHKLYRTLPFKLARGTTQVLYNQKRTCHNLTKCNKILKKPSFLAELQSIDIKVNLMNRHAQHCFHWNKNRFFLYYSTSKTAVH